MKRFLNCVLGLGMLAFTAPAAEAALVQIQMTGLDFNYNEGTGTFCDSGGGVGCFGAADPLDGAFYKVGGVTQGVELSNIAINMLLYLPAGTSPTVNATTALLNVGNDVFDLQRSGGPGLFTDVTTGSITFSNGSLNATGTGFSSVFSQGVLPFGLPAAADPVNWSFSLGLGACTGSVGSQVCTYSGTGEFSYQSAVPEPASMLLFGTGLAGLAAVTRRRRKV